MEVEEAIVSSITITACIMIPSSAKVAATMAMVRNQDCKNL